MGEAAVRASDGFESLGLVGEVAATLVALGYKEPTPIKREERMVRIRIALGRKSNTRQGDLVEAIANEASISGSGIGKIEMANAFSLVEVRSHRSIRSSKRWQMRRSADCA